MAKKKKNSNYVTEKTIEAKRKQLEEKRRKRKKQIIFAVIIPVLSLLLIAGAVLGIAYASGAFEYTPEVTYHAAIEIENYGTLHVELYGNDAPITVNNFIRLAGTGYFDGTSFHKIIDNLMYAGTLNAGRLDGIKGEFSENGVENKISHIRGTLSMSRSSDFDTAYSQFFVVRKTDRSLDGSYAAFGRITDGMDIIDKIYSDASVSETGEVDAASAAKIKSITLHASH